MNRRRCSMKTANQTKRQRSILAACFLTMVSAASGQERKLTLQEAIDLAVRQNRALKIAQYDVAAELQKQRGAKSDYFPTVHNDSNAIYITNVERIQVPPGAFGVIPGGALIPPSTVYLTQGENAYQTSGTQLSQPITQLIKIHDANKVAAADVGISKASLERLQPMLSMECTSSTMPSLLPSCSGKQRSCKLPPATRVWPKMASSSRTEVC